MKIASTSHSKTPRQARADAQAQPRLWKEDHCTFRVTVALLFVMFRSRESASVAPFSVITDPVGAVTFTVSRTVHVEFEAMLPFSLHITAPLPPNGGVV